MNNFEFLIVENDISSIETTYSSNTISIIIKFEWEIDCGCFSCKRDSTLTILISNKSEDMLINDLKNKRGKAYEYILNHRQYVGKLLDLKGEYND